jgi:hypothetical protein
MAPDGYLHLGVSGCDDVEATTLFQCDICYGNEIRAGEMADFLASSTMARLQSRKDQYCTTSEATAPVNFDSPPQLEPRLGSRLPFSVHDAATNCRRPAEGSAYAVLSRPESGCGLFCKSAFCDGFPVCLEWTEGGMMVALLCG